MSDPYQIPAGETRPWLQGRRILIVDDDAAARAIGRDMLVRYRCLIEQAHNGAEACAIAEKMEGAAPFDIIIAAIRLPDMSVADLFLKLSNILGVVPMIATCSFGYDVAVQLVKARRVGVLAAVYKPFRREQLMGTIDRVVVGDLCKSEILR